MKSPIVAFGIIPEVERERERERAFLDRQVELDKTLKRIQEREKRIQEQEKRIQEL
jgi:hypothetical protein